MKEVIGKSMREEGKRWDTQVKTKNELGGKQLKEKDTS